MVKHKKGKDTRKLNDENVIAEYHKEEKKRERKAKRERIQKLLDELGEV